MSAVIGNRHVAASNRARAPITGAFVQAMRISFGSVQIIHVAENGLLLGAPPQYSGAFVSAADMALREPVKE